MAGNHMIRFRVNKEQFDRIRSDALNSGYLTPSAYMRDLALNKSPVYLELKMGELLKEFKQIKEVLCNG
ncbi:MAG: hypothetical protein KKD17_04415 [Nanoarchaeota archaeon]|nr:hypothetical protein [Nanoarchaeota archaeon]